MPVDYKKKYQSVVSELKKLQSEHDEALVKLRRAEPALHLARCPVYEHEHKDDYKRTFEMFWKSLVMIDGKWDFDAVMKELHDYHTALLEVPKVYMHITGGLLSKPTTMAEHVIGAFDERIDDDYQKEMEDLRNKISKFERVVREIFNWIESPQTDVGFATPSEPVAQGYRMAQEIISDLLKGFKPDDKG